MAKSLDGVLGVAEFGALEFGVGGPRGEDGCLRPAAAAMSAMARWCRTTMSR